jgi:hypothetical protein
MSSICTDIELLSTAISLNYVASSATAEYTEDSVIPTRHKFFLLAYWITSPKYRGEAWLQLATDIPAPALKEFKQRVTQGHIPPDCMRDKEALIRDYKLAARPTKTDAKQDMSKLHYAFPSVCVCEEGLERFRLQWEELDARAAQAVEDQDFGAEEVATEEEAEGEAEGEEEDETMPMGVEIGEGSEGEEGQQPSSPSLSNVVMSDIDSGGSDVDYEFSGPEPEGEAMSEDEEKCNSPALKQPRLGCSPSKHNLQRGAHILEDLLEEEASEIEEELGDSFQGKLHFEEEEKKKEEEEEQEENEEEEEEEEKEEEVGNDKVKEQGKKLTPVDYENAFFEARAECLNWHPIQNQAMHYHALSKDAVLKADAVVNPRDTGAVHSHGARYTELDLTLCSDEGDALCVEQGADFNMLSNDLLYHTKTGKWCAAPIYSNDALVPTKRMSTVSYADIKAVHFSAPNRQRLKWGFVDTAEFAKAKLIPVNICEFSKRIRVWDSELRSSVFVNKEHPLCGHAGFIDYCKKKDQELHNLLNGHLSSMEMLEYLRKRNICNKDPIGDLRMNRCHVDISEKIERLCDWAADDICSEIAFHVRANNKRGIRATTNAYCINDQCKKVVQAEALIKIIIGHDVRLPAKALDLPKVIHGGKRCRQSPSKKDVGRRQKMAPSKGRPRGAPASKRVSADPPPENTKRKSVRNTTKAAREKKVDTRKSQVRMCTVCVNMIYVWQACG